MSLSRQHRGSRGASRLNARTLGCTALLMCAACGGNGGGAGLDAASESDASDRDGSQVLDGSTQDGSVSQDGSQLDDGAVVDGDGSVHERDPDAGDGGGDGDGDGDGDGEGDAGVEAPAFSVSAIAVGYNHACAIHEGELHCWGANSLGQLGLGDSDARSAPERVGTHDDWESVSAGRFHTCGLRSGGALYCWGGSAFGQTGTVTSSVLEPRAITAPEGQITEVSTGEWHSCALTDTGHVYCWGYNLLGRLGDGTGAGTTLDPQASVPELTQVDASASFVTVSAGAAHTCAIDDAGEVWCWGNAEHGRIGNAGPDACTLSESSVACALSPVALGDGRDYAAVSAGGAHTCAREAGGTGQLYCWGSGEYGQLGLGDTDSRDAPSSVADGVTRVASGGAHTCVLHEDSELRCFGDGENGQLGTAASQLTSPSETVGDGSWTSIASGPLGGCAINEANDGYCWGFSAYAGTEAPTRVFPVSM